MLMMKGEIDSKCSPDGINLVDYVNRSLEDQEQFHFLRFEFLQRLNITRLEVELVRFKSQVQQQHDATPEQLTYLTDLLKEHADAIRNYEYLKQHNSLSKPEAKKRKYLLQRYFQRREDFNDPFESHYSAFGEAPPKIDPLRTTLMRTLPSRLTFSKREKHERKKEYLEGQPPLEVSNFVDRLSRLLISIMGGLFVVVPMIIMSLGQSQAKSLITVSVGVVVFALLVSFGYRVSNIETLISTATYSAVLVVFVGTSTGSNGS